MNLFMNRTLAVALLLSAGMAARGEGESWVCQSTERKTSLVELYTSEGCSSCPPAERWFTGLKDSPMLWKDFVPLAFHVDYWNHLGWRDPWSQTDFTKRQTAYAELWQSESVYTPEFVLNGKEWQVSGARREIPAPADTKVGVLTARLVTTNRWRVSFSPVRSQAGEYEVNAALLESGISSHVKAGENRGRKLVHDFAVIKLTKDTLSLRDGTCSGEVTLPPPERTLTGRLAIAFWVTQLRQMQSIQATGGWLPPAQTSVESPNEAPK